MGDEVLVRGVRLPGAVALNVISMVGIGPLITVPLVLGALHGPLSIAGWLLGALLALCDGMVWAELGSLFPGSGGTYRFFLGAFGRGGLGRFLAFLFVWQIMFVAPLNQATGYIGFADYAAYLFPAAGGPAAVKAIAIAIGIVTLLALYRGIAAISRIGIVLFGASVVTLLCVIAASFAHFSPAHAFAVPAHDSLWGGLRAGLGQGLIIAMYDYLGYNQSSCIGAEIVDPKRTIPRSIVISILLVAALYIAMQIGILGALPWQALVPLADGSLPPLGQHIASAIVLRTFGAAAAAAVTGLVLLTAFASVYGNLLGFSRIPFAAAADGLFLRPFAHVHKRHRFPDVALVSMGVLALAASLLPLAQVIDALTAGIVLIQSIGQIAALVRVRASGAVPPYRMFCYPVPAVAALAGWIYVFISTGSVAMGFGLLSLAAGAAVFLIKERSMLTSSRFIRFTCWLLVLAVAFASVATPLRVSAAGGVTGNLRGSVVDQQGGAPIAGVQINAVSASGRFTASTDAAGYFSLLQIPTDTYVLDFVKQGYSSFTITGVTVMGDQTQNVGQVRLTREIKTIAQVHSRSASSAFQPHQTTDETTFSGQRVDQALGETGSTDYNKLVLSAPGVIQTAQGSNSPISIRGSASVEIGYQFDGIDFRGAFFDENPSQGFLNGIGGGRGAMQVVSGAGDATQGGIGAGVVNLIPGRGSYPGSGFLSADVGSPWYDHAFAAQYGIATPNGRFSDFFSVRSDRSAPQIAPYGRDASDAGAYFGTSFSYDDDVLNNFEYRFGRDNDQQFQVLSDFMDHRSWGNYGGLAAAAFYPWNPLSYQQFQSDFNGAPAWGCLYPQPQSPLGPGASPPSCPDGGLSWYDATLTYLPGVPHTNQPVTQPEQYLIGPTDVLKIGYTRQLNRNATWNTFFYNWGGLIENNITGNYSDLTDGAFTNGYNPAGSRSTGVQTQLTVAAGQKHILTLVGKFENNFPYWNQQNNGNTWQGLFQGRAQDESNAGYVNSAIAGYSPNGPRIEDWYLPLIPGQPVSASNPCIGPALDNNFTPDTPTSMGCYLYNWLLANGKWTGRLPAMPTAGWNYHNSDFQQFGIGLRDQWNPNSKLYVDYGLRLDGQNLKWGANPFSKDLSNPGDVGIGFAKLVPSFLTPRLVQPRASVNYLFDPNDSARIGFGRSVSFFFGQTAGTPSALENVDPIYLQIPAKDSPASPACGSGWHGPGTNGNGTYVQNPNVYFSGSSVLGTPAAPYAGWFFQCPNYASALYWNFDQGYSAPDLGGQQPATYNNWDLSFQHQFKNQWGAKLTAYTRRGYDTYQVVELNAGPPNPVTGQQTAGSFQERETGIQKAFGLEFMLTTPDRPYGWSGFLTANYVNELTNTPPVQGSDSLAIAQQFLYETNVLFHQGYLPPLSARAGITYATKSGFRVNPIFEFDGGEPFGVGRDAIGYVNGVLYHLPTGNLGVATPYAGPGLPNQPYNATCYVDPAFAGSYFHPKDFACRGNNEPALAGQAFTRPRLYGDVDFEYTKGRATWGIYVANLFDNYRGQPVVNQDWQPVATGVGGAQTGQYAGAFPVNLDGTPNLSWITGGRDMSKYDQYWLPFQEYYVPGRNYRFYLRIQL